MRRFFTRRGLLWSLCLVFLYPLLRFSGFKAPRKPVRVALHKRVTTRGVLVHERFVLFDQDGRQWALSRKCTHLGCKLNYSEERGLLECPCHTSQFDSASGAVLQGPAKRSLPAYPVEKREKDPFYVVTITS